MNVSTVACCYRLGFLLLRISSCSCFGVLAIAYCHCLLLRSALGVSDPHIRNPQSKVSQSFLELLYPPPKPSWAQIVTSYQTMDHSWRANVSWSHFGPTLALSKWVIFTQDTSMAFQEMALHGLTRPLEDSMAYNGLLPDGHVTSQFCQVLKTRGKP